MIIGSGLLAQAFLSKCGQSEGLCIYSAGVSNSGCRDIQEFSRERRRLTEALRCGAAIDTFIYFGTCSISDHEAFDTPYVQHKLAMERLVSAHPRHLILRLPQVAGRTPNPHTLLNHLYARIMRSESFSLWQNARRNIIDVDDVVAITRQIIAEPALRNIIVNIASEVNYPMSDIVAAMENVVGKRAIYELADRGSSYPIDTRPIQPFLDAAGVRFDVGYLQRTINKYYGKAA